MADNPTETRTETEALKKDVEQLRADLTALTESMKQRTNERTHARMDRARGQMRTAAQEGERYARQVCKEIEARPFVSILAGIGLGVLLGRLFSR